MITVFRRVHLPAWRRAPLGFLLPCLGIAVGVGAILAIDLGSASTVSSFRRTIDRIEGRTTHQVKGTGSPLDPALAAELATRDGVEAAAPVLETFVLLAADSPSTALRGGGEPLRLIGLDPFAETDIRALGLEEIEEVAGQEGLFFRLLSEPGALVISRPFLERHGLTVGDSLSLVVGARPARAFVLGRLPQRVGDLSVPDNLALCDLATAQELTGRQDASRIDLVLRDDADVQALRASLPAGVALEAPGGRAARLDEMVRALGVNLRALSYLALFVSLFLIYNALVLAVLRRRASIGLVRCLGATRGAVLGAWLLEGLALGSVGTALGIGFGLVGGGVALEGVQSTASGLYGTVSQGAVALEPWSFVKAVGVGLVAALLAAAWPALEAARTVPAHTSARGDQEERTARMRRWTALLAVPLLAAAFLALRWPSRSPIPGYLAAMFLSLAAGVLTPAVAHALLGVALRPLRRLGFLPHLAARNLRAGMSRTGVALAALAVALSMSVAMGTMVSAFRSEVIGWIGETVAADIYLSPATAQFNRSQARLTDALAARLAARPEVEKVDSIRGEEVDADGVATWCAGIQLEIQRTEARTRLLEGPSIDEYFERLQAGQAGITESLFRKIGKGPGDTLTVSSGSVQAELVIAGVYKDYSSDRGVVLLDRATFERLFGPRQPNGLALYLVPGVDADGLVDRLQRALSSEWSLVIRSNRSLRQEALTVFDRTFAVSRALESIGIAVAAIGILSALLAMLLERRREIATLRALALTRAQVGRLLLTESVLLALLAWLLALGLGSALAWILLRVINVRSFGWSLPWSWPVETWSWNLLFGVAAAVLATLYPIVRSGRLSIAAGLREE